MSSDSAPSLRTRLPEIAQPTALATVAVCAIALALVWSQSLPPTWDRTFASEIGFALLAAAGCCAACVRFAAAKGRSARWAHGSLAASFALWLAVEIVELVDLALAIETRFELASDLTYLLAYSLVLVAAETVAGRSGRGRGTFHVQIELLATVLVVDAILCYFLILPYNLDASNSLRSASWWSYYTLFDLLLLGRLVPLAWRMAPGPRRRFVGWLAAMTALLLCADLGETIWRMEGGSGRSPSLFFTLYYSALLAGAIAAGTNLGRERGTDELAIEALEANLALPQFSPVLAYVVALPLAHLLLNSIEPAPESYRGARDALLIATTGILGALAAWSWSSFRRHHAHVLAASERATEALSRSRHLESVGRLAAGVAHDFNNRLTVILGYASRLRGRAADDAAREQAAAAIAEAADQASRLTMELLAVGRVQPGRPARIDLAELAEDLAGEARQLAAPGISVELKKEARSLPIEVDRMHLLRVVWNLAANASDAMPAGGPIELIVGARRIEVARDAAGESIPPGDYALLAVADRGVGMSDETIGKLFDPFFTTKEFGHGSGLGLAAVLGLIRSNGGYVTVESTPGRGSRFDVLFPLSERTPTDLRF